MIDAKGLLKIIDDKSKQPKNIYFGTISDDLRVIFDGEVTPTQKNIACISYTPVAGDRVVIYKQGQVCLILGNIGPGGVGGDTSEIYRSRIIQDILAIGQIIALDATWDFIDAKIRSFYVPGFVTKISDSISVKPLNDYISVLIPSTQNSYINDLVYLNTISDSVQVSFA